MDKQDKAKLTLVMNFSLKLGNLDSSITKEIKALAAYGPGELTDSTINSMEQKVLDTAQINPAFIDFFNGLADSMTFLDYEFLKRMIVVETAQLMTPDQIRAYLQDAPKFANDGNEFRFYHALVNRAIATRDSGLIKEAIDHIQSL